MKNSAEPDGPCMTLERTMRSGGAFTLIELLAVITTLATVAAILRPALAKAKGAGERVNCINNCRQWSLAILMYEGDHGSSAPTSGDSFIWPWHPPDTPMLAWNRLSSPRAIRSSLQPSSDIRAVRTSPLWTDMLN